MLNIPNRLKIMNHDVSIGLYNLNNNFNNKVYGGQADMYNNQIKIQLDMPQTQKEHILLHEIIEFIDGLNDLKLNHTQISTIANCLHQVITENPNCFNNNQQQIFSKEELSELRTLLHNNIVKLRQKDDIAHENQLKLDNELIKKIDDTIT